MKRLILYLGLVFLFAGCGQMGPPIPLTLEERQAREKAREIRSHCEDVGIIALDRFVAERKEEKSGRFGGIVMSGKKARVVQTAYRECMYRYGYRP